MCAANGNPTTYKSTTLTFDVENRMTAYGSTMSAGYNGVSLRAWKTAGGTRTYYLYDSTTLLCELNSSGTVLATNTVGVNGLVSRRVGSTSTFYVYDPQGSVAQRLNSSGTVLSSDLYDAYGKKLAPTDTTSDPYGYNGQWGYYTDSENGLALCTYRYYDPANGRWVTRDPIGYDGAANLYGYVGNRPVGGVDPEGLCPDGDCFTKCMDKCTGGLKPNYSKLILCALLWVGQWPNWPGKVVSKWLIRLCGAYASGVMLGCALQCEMECGPRGSMRIIDPNTDVEGAKLHDDMWRRMGRRIPQN